MRSFFEKPGVKEAYAAEMKKLTDAAEAGDMEALSDQRINEAIERVVAQGALT